MNITKNPTPRAPAWLAALHLLAGAPVAVHASNVVINRDKVLEIDGVKTFVIGFTLPPPVEGKTPEGKNAIDELAQAGATFLRAGPLGSPWNEQRFAEERKYEDAAAAHKMHCWLSLREAASIKPGQTNVEQLLRKILNTFKDHPGLGAYKGEDEPEWGKHSIPAMKRAYEIIKEVDPHHPVVIIEAPRGTSESLRKYNSVKDINGVDIYPVGFPPGKHSQFSATNSTLSMVGDYTRLMRRVSEEAQPIWVTLQVSWSGVLKPGQTLRYPSFPEQRFMTYQAIINGARGINYFGGSLPGGLTEEDKKLGWNWRFWSRVLKPVIQEIGAKGPLYPALVAPESDLPVKAEGKGIEFCVREAGNSIFLLACKREGPAIQASFSGIPAGISTGEVLFEEPRIISVKKGTLTDWFAPFDVHVYRFGR
jgi:hypothetical protein